MKRFALAGTITALLAITLAFTACGGDDDGGKGDTSSNIRTQQGLAVANLVAELNGGAQSGNALAPGAAVPAEDEADASSRSASSLGSGSDAVSGYAPAFQSTGGGAGITAFGYGSATADADSAIIEMYFYRYSDGGIVVPEEPSVVPDASGSSGSSEGTSDEKPLPTTLAEVAPITQADLQPVIDAMTAAGADSVEFVPQTYFDSYSASATLRATVNNVDNVDAVVQAGTDAGSNLGDISFSGANTSYTLQDCAALETAAMTAAVDDAHSRADALAGVLDVTIGSVIGAADQSYYPYGGAPCSSSYGGPIPYAYDTKAEGVAGPGEVQVFAQVSVTYGIQ